MTEELIIFKKNNEQLPEGWDWSLLEEVADVVAGNPAPQGELFFENGIYPFVRVQDMGCLGSQKLLNQTNDYINDKAIEKLKLIPKGSVLFTKSGASTLLNQRAVLGSDMYVVSHIAAAIPYDGIISEWLYYWLKTIDFNYIAHATTLPSLPLSKARRIPVPIAPENEQKRIVAEIEKQFSRIDEAVDNLKRVKANLKRYKASVLKAAVEGKLTEDWRKANPDVEPASKLLERILAERRKKWEEAEMAKMKAKGKMPKDDKWKKKYKVPALPDRLEFPLIPNAWVWATPKLLATDDDNAICAGPFGTIFKAKDFRSQGIPIIFLRHVAPGEYLTHKPGFMDTAKWNELFQTYSVNGGELLITKLGDPPGVCAIYPKNIGPAMVTPDVIKMSVNEDFVAPSYLMNYFNSQISKSFVTGFAFGTTRLRLTLPIFRNFPVPLPSVKEQHQIIAEIDTRISIVKRLEEIIQKSLIRAERFSQSVLKSAFTGKLVKQDPLDEPARNLLKRIKAEREKQEDELRKKRKKAMTTKEKPKKKRDILAVLKGSEAPMRPEDLFRIAGYEPVEVEDFYADLKIADQQKTISQIKKKNGEVFLRAV